MTPTDQKRLNGVSPALFTAIGTLLAEFPVFVVEGVRTAERQHELYLHGRDKDHPGPILTNCDGYVIRSNHQPHADGFGWAVDVAFLPTRQTPDPWSPTWPWASLGAAAQRLGLVWGGTFPRRDLDHLELAPLPVMSGPDVTKL